MFSQLKNSKKNKRSFQTEYFIFYLYPGAGSGTVVDSSVVVVVVGSSVVVVVVGSSVVVVDVLLVKHKVRYQNQALIYQGIENQRDLVYKLAETPYFLRGHSCRTCAQRSMIELELLRSQRRYL